jgi:hypothetical protein
VVYLGTDDQRLADPVALHLVQEQFNLTAGSRVRHRGLVGPVAPGMAVAVDYHGKFLVKISILIGSKRMVARSSFAEMYVQSYQPMKMCVKKQNVCA